MAFVTRTSTYRNYMKKYLMDGTIELIVFDCETIGLKKDSEIIELAARKVRFNNGHMEVIDSLDIYIKPKERVSEHIVQLTKITNEFLSDKPDEKDCFEIIDSFFGKYPMVVGYNVSFDVNKIAALYERVGKSEFLPALEVDVLNIARDVISDDEAKVYENQIMEQTGKNSLHSLAATAIVLGCDTSQITFHNALSDVDVTIMVLEKLWNRYMKLDDEKDLMKTTVKKVSIFEVDNKNPRIYIATLAGVLYYDTRTGNYISESFDITKIDINDLERKLLEKYNVATIKDIITVLKKEDTEDYDSNIYCISNMADRTDNNCKAGY